MLVATHTNRLTDTIAESFRESVDGFWYPVEPGTPLVRISIAGSSYQIERRRNERSAWMPVVVAEAAEFDASAFRTWRGTWKCVQV